MKMNFSTPSSGVPIWQGPFGRVLRRWVTFNVVGIMGVGVQIITLVMLRNWSQMDYLLATALAVQAAVLHNFVWHERWTWWDRTANHDSSRLARLLRFNLTIGALSIGENLLFMGFLVGRFEIHYLSANLIAIACCSVLNFVASDRLVFREAL